MRECLLSMARACALVKLVVGSSFIDSIQSPTPIRPSRLIEPPWIMLRTIIPEPSLLELTVIPLRKKPKMRSGYRKYYMKQGGASETCRGSLAPPPLSYRAQSNSQAHQQPLLGPVWSPGHCQFGILGFEAWHSPELSDSYSWSCYMSSTAPRLCSCHQVQYTALAWATPRSSTVPRLCNFCQP